MGSSSSSGSGVDSSSNVLKCDGTVGSPPKWLLLRGSGSNSGSESDSRSSAEKQFLLAVVVQGFGVVCWITVQRLVARTFVMTSKYIQL